MHKLYQYIAVGIGLILLMAQGLSPALSYDDAFFHDQLEDIQDMDGRLDFQLEELKIAQQIQNKKQTAVQNLIQSYQLKIADLEEKITIRRLQLADEPSLSLSDDKANLEQRHEGFLNDQKKLFALSNHVARLQDRFELLMQSTESSLAQNAAKQEVFQQLLVQARQEKLASYQALTAYTEREDQIRALLQNSSSDLMWPVEPELGISANFHDPAYKARFGLEHNAIDIPVMQGSEIRAAADGVVVQAKDSGLGYSYISLGHNNGVLTTYGHVSEIFAKEGEVVEQGDIIGLSGGAPGTAGAGYRTTGAHVHFEVRVDGEHVDPLDYLDM